MWVGVMRHGETSHLEKSAGIPVPRVSRTFSWLIGDGVDKMRELPFPTLRETWFADNYEGCALWGGFLYSNGTSPKHRWVARGAHELQIVVGADLQGFHTNNSLLGCSYIQSHVQPFSLLEHSSLLSSIALVRFQVFA